MGLIFEWDETKALINVQKHGVDFKEAVTVFMDPNALTIFDVVHSDEEDRFIDIGLSTSGRVLVVVYTDRDKRICIISCRKATPLERSQYEQEEI